MVTKTILRLGIDGKMIVGFANSVMFGFYVRGQRVRGLLQKKLEEIAHRRSMELSIDAPISGCTDDGDEGQTWGRRLADDRPRPDEDLEAQREEISQRTDVERVLHGAIKALPAIIEATEQGVERETLAGILAYAQTCTEEGVPALLSAVGIEMVSPDGHRALVEAVRLGRCLGQARTTTTIPGEGPGGVSIVPKQNWKTSKKLEAFLHQQLDTTIEWASVSQAAIHKRIIRAIPILEAHALVTDMLFHEEDL